MSKELHNIYLYTKDTSEQSQRQVIVLMRSLFRKGFSIYYNTSWNNITLNEIKDISCKLNLEEYIKIFTNKSTVFFSFLPIETIRLRKKIKNHEYFKIIYRIRGVLPEESFYRNKSVLRKKVLNFIEKKAIKLSDYYSFVSDAQRIHFVSKYNNVCSVFSNSFIIQNYSNRISVSDINCSQKDTSRNKIRLVYSGAFSKWQMIESIFNLIKNIYKEFNDVEFNIYTFSENNKIAEEMLDKYKIEHISKVLNLKPNEIHNHLNKNDIGIIIRDNSLVNITSSPFKISDYLSAGLGLIMTNNIGDYPRILQDKGYVFLLNINESGLITYDIDEMITFLKRIQLSELKNAIAKDFFEVFNMDKEIDNFSNFLKNVF